MVCDEAVGKHVCGCVCVSACLGCLGCRGGISWEDGFGASRKKPASKCPSGLSASAAVCGGVFVLTGERHVSPPPPRHVLSVCFCCLLPPPPLSHVCRWQVLNKYEGDPILAQPELQPELVAESGQRLPHLASKLLQNVSGVRVLVCVCVLSVLVCGASLFGCVVFPVPSVAACTWVSGHVC